MDDLIIEEPGSTREIILSGYNEKIKSKEINSFEYTGNSFKVECKKDNNKLHIESSGGYSNKRDGTYFHLDYYTEDYSLLKELQKIIDEYNISKNNGYSKEVEGLPSGLGDYISVIYESGERIYKYSNQSPTVIEEAQIEIYNAFKKSANDNNLDFNSSGSNVKLYDDADEEFLQGTWEGKHFGSKIKVIFKDKNIKIYEDDILKDDTECVIYEGCIRPNKLKDGIKEIKSEYDYEEFNTLSCLKKKNNILLTAYFFKPAYSTAELLKEKKEK